MSFFEQFWSPRERYEACGMFTEGHFVLLFLSIMLLCILLHAFRNSTKRQMERMVRVFAILMVVLESTKIIFNFYHGYTWLNAWFPIAYCSIFMYALCLSGFGKGKWKEMGDSFLGGVSVVAGATYLLFPSTSLMLYPKWNFLCLYSMFFHTLMVFVGILYFRKLNYRLNRKSYHQYLKLYLFFAIVAICLNTAFGSNLMMLRAPFQIPVKFLHTLYEAAPWGYTALVFVVYLLVPFGVTAYASKVWGKDEREECKEEMNATI